MRRPSLRLPSVLCPSVIAVLLGDVLAIHPVMATDWRSQIGHSACDSSTCIAYGTWCEALMWFEGIEYCVPDCSETDFQTWYTSADCPECSLNSAEFICTWEALCECPDSETTCVCPDDPDGFQHVEGISPGPDPEGCPDSTWAGVRSPNSIDLWHGDKFEEAVDIRVRLPGKDFTISRQYTSSPDFVSTGAIGNRWTLSALRRLDHFSSVGETGFEMYRFASRANRATCLRVPDSGDPPWDLHGPTSQTFHDEASYGGTNTYRLSDPGRWDMHFNRGSNDGKIHVISDTNGNIQEFEYSELGHLHAIYCNPRSNKAYWDAKITFSWRGPRVELIQVWRHDIGGNVEMTQAVEYTYYDSTDSSLSDDLGADGDLIMVTQYERVDPPADEPPGSLDTGELRARVTQYRYHTTAVGASTGVSDRYTWQGGFHQLKMVILPEQVEYYVQHAATALTVLKYVEDLAPDLLALDDGDTAFSIGEDDVLLVDLAAKVLEEYETGGEQRVETQYIQSACGCSGSATQGLKLSYSYLEYADDQRTAVITEEAKNGTNWDTYRTTYHDLALLGDEPDDEDDPDLRSPYLIMRAIIDDPAAQNPKKWVTRQVFDDHRNVVRVITPSALEDPENDYDEATASTAPVYGPSVDSGLVYAYAYTDKDSNAGNYRTEIRVGEGYKDNDGETEPSPSYDPDDLDITDYTLIERTEYDDLGAGWDEDNSRPHLPSRIRRYRTVAAGNDPDSAGDDEVEETLFYYGFHTEDEDDIAYVQRVVESELTEENGPDTTWPSYEFFDEAGNNTWSYAADTSVTRRVFDTGTANQSYTGQLATIERNAPKTGFPDDGPYPDTTDWLVRYHEGGSLTTDYTLDLLGRVHETISPGMVHTYTRRELRSNPERPNLYYYAVVTLPHELTAGTEYADRASITWYNAGNDVIASHAHTVTAGYTIHNEDTGYRYVVFDYTLSNDLIARSSSSHDVSGLMAATRVWHDASDASGYYETVYEYDTAGRVSEVTNPVGTITKRTYDELDRVTVESIGTTSESPVTVRKFIYDGTGSAAGVGNGNLTRLIAYEDGSTTRSTDYTYDFRDRRVLTENPIAPHMLVEYDNLDRVTGQGVFTSVPTLPYTWTGTDATRGRYTQTDYSQRGLAYRQRTAIDPGDPSGSIEFLETHTWYDEVGRAVQTWGPNAPAVKTTHDGLGRPTTVYVTDRGGDDQPGEEDSWIDVYDVDAQENDRAADVDGDTILEQTSYHYLNSGRVDLVTSSRRTHDADITGDLLSYTTGDDAKMHIETFVATHYDNADRPIYLVNYGTNQSEFKYGSSEPDVEQGTIDDSESEDALITTTTYGSRGLVETSTSPEGQVMTYFYDDLDRRIAVVENSDAESSVGIAWTTDDGGRWEVTGSALDNESPAVNRVTSSVYDGNSNVVKQVAHFPDSSNDEDRQITEYEYGVDSSKGSDLASNDLLYRVKYPDETDGDAGGSTAYHVTSEYNRLGEVLVMTDQAGTEHTYTRDELGRVRVDAATTLGSNIDTAILAIGTVFDTLGRVSTVTSFNDDDAGAGDEENQVKYTYNGLWQVAEFAQEFDGTVDGNTLMVTYDYAQEAFDDEAAGAMNYSRQSSITYPDGSVVNHDYDDGDDVNDVISRLYGIDWGDEGTYQDAAYHYAGESLFAIVDYADPDVQLDRTASHIGKRTYGAETGTAGAYPGFDRFGRAARHLWVDGDFDENTGSVPNIPPIVEYTYAYDDDSNRKERFDTRPGASWLHKDYQYGYDGLDRLLTADRGAANGSFTYAEPSSAYTVSTYYDMDMLGNWNTFIEDDDTSPANGATLSGDLEEARLHNYANELTQVDPDGAAGPYPLTYDAAGNIRTQKIGALATRTYTHDAWNRLVKVVRGAYVDGEYEYNGLTHRIVKRADTTGNGTLDQQRLMYYSVEWQLLEERIDDDATFSFDPDSTDVERHHQYIWGPRYIDDIILHREDLWQGGNQPNGTYNEAGEETYYHLTDAMFSTVAIIDDAAQLEERILYDPYGQARHHWPKDANGDGVHDSSDQTYIWNLSGEGIDDAGYEADADLDRDGDVDITDYVSASGSHSALAVGEISSDDVNNVIGWDGYVFNEETQQYKVRYRDYSTELGRWLERDPAGYPDGMNLFAAMLSSPATYADPTGEQSALERRECQIQCNNNRAFTTPGERIACLSGCISAASRTGRTCASLCSMFVLKSGSRLRAQYMACMWGCRRGNFNTQPSQRSYPWGRGWDVDNCIAHCKAERIRAYGGLGAPLPGSGTAAQEISWIEARYKRCIEDCNSGEFDPTNRCPDNWDPWTTPLKVDPNAYK